MPSSPDTTPPSVEDALIAATARETAALVTSTSGRPRYQYSGPSVQDAINESLRTSRRSQAARSASGPTATLLRAPRRSGWRLLESLADTLATPTSGEPVIASYVESAWRLSIQSQSSFSPNRSATGHSGRTHQEPTAEIELKLYAPRRPKPATSSHAPTAWRAEVLWGDAEAVSASLHTAYLELSRRISATS